MTNEDQVIEQALEILASRMRKHAPSLTGSSDAVRYLCLQLGNRKAECFAVLFLDSQHRVIAFREMFFGTIDAASVYPREVVRAVLDYNAAAVILAHNHPSGVAEPSRSDIAITERLRTILAVIDTRVLDHVVVAGTQATSMAERGLL